MRLSSLCLVQVYYISLKHLKLRIQWNPFKADTIETTTAWPEYRGSHHSGLLVYFWFVWYCVVRLLNIMRSHFQISLLLYDRKTSKMNNSANTMLSL